MTERSYELRLRGIVPLDEIRLALAGRGEDRHLRTVLTVEFPEPSDLFGFLRELRAHDLVVHVARAESATDPAYTLTIQGVPSSSLCSSLLRRTAAYEFSTAVRIAVPATTHFADLVGGLESHGLEVAALVEVAARDRLPLQRVSAAASQLAGVR